MKKLNKNNFFNGSPKNLAFVAILLLASLAFLVKLTEYSRQIKMVSYSKFLNLVENDEVKKIHVSGQEVQGELKDGSRIETTIANVEKDYELLRTHDVDVLVTSSSGQYDLWYLMPFITLLFGGLIAAWYFVRQSRGGSGSNNGGNIFSMGKSRARLHMPSTIKEKFDDVAGIPEAKEELKDLVDFLKNPKKYERLGARVTRGVLLVGEPGNGKTLLARAVAGEANCPFFSVSGSDFLEVFVGVGAARVRDLFAQARKNAPCIVFIDEIDAVGRQRGSGVGGGNDEREQTLNQLLTEMDGFVTDGGSVIVLAATNRPDVLDKALLRAGRFDRRVEVPYPDLESREHILRVHAKKVKMSPDIDLKKIARGTPMFSGADLANLINEAAILASRNNQDLVTIDDFEESRDKILLGKERKSVKFTEEDRKIISFHESGHALIRLLMPDDSDPLHKITIIPRGSALGVTHSMPEREKYLQNKEEMIALIMAALGGRAAEELVFGKITTGGYSDFMKATDVARKMVCNYGMSQELGTAVYEQRSNNFYYSEKTAERIDQEVQKILDTCYKKTMNMLMVNRDKLDKLATTLIEKETLYAADIYLLLEIEPRAEFSFS